MITDVFGYLRPLRPLTAWLVLGILLPQAALAQRVPIEGIVPDDLLPGALPQRANADENANYEEGRIAFVDGDAQRAEVIWLSLAQGGGPDAIQAKYGLANLYEFGDRRVDEAPALAAALYGEACRAGIADACTNLGVMYSLGRGVEQRENVAVQLWQVASDRGHCLANFNLGLAYYSGRGLEQDRSIAVDRIFDAADCQVPEAQYAICQFYRLGLGVPVIPGMALSYCQRASANGNENAQEIVGELVVDGITSIDLDTVDRNGNPIEPPPIGSDQVARSTPGQSDDLATSVIVKPDQQTQDARQQAETPADQSSASTDESNEESNEQSDEQSDREPDSGPNGDSANDLDRGTESASSPSSDIRTLEDMRTDTATLDETRESEPPNQEDQETSLESLPADDQTSDQQTGSQQSSDQQGSSQQTSSQQRSDQQGSDQQSSDQQSSDQPDNDGPIAQAPPQPSAEGDPQDPIEPTTNQDSIMFGGTAVQPPAPVSLMVLPNSAQPATQNPENQDPARTATRNPSQAASQPTNLGPAAQTATPNPGQANSNVPVSAPSFGQSFVGGSNANASRTALAPAAGGSGPSIASPNCASILVQCPGEGQAIVPLVPFEGYRLEGEDISETALPVRPGFRPNQRPTATAPRGELIALWLGTGNDQAEAESLWRSIEALVIKVLEQAEPIYINTIIPPEFLEESQPKLIVRIYLGPIPTEAIAWQICNVLNLEEPGTFCRPWNVNSI